MKCAPAPAHLWVNHGGVCPQAVPHLQTSCLVTTVRAQPAMPYLGTQLGDDRSISQVAKRFMGTGMLPEPRTPAPAKAPVGRLVGANPPPAPLLGFRKAARAPPLSTAAAIITSTARGAALAKCRTNAGSAGLCAACCLLPAPAPPDSEMLIGAAGRGGAGDVTADGGSVSASRVGHVHY